MLEYTKGLVLSPLLFLIVLEALSREFRTGCPWELLYADDLAIVADSMDNLIAKLVQWKDHFASKGLKVNMPKTKIMACGRNLNTLKDSGKFPCGVCCKGVGSNSIYYNGYKHWTHKKCSMVKNRLHPDPDFRCQRCLGTAPPIEKRVVNSVLVSNEPVVVFDNFCYLGDIVTPGGGCAEATVNRSRIAWGKFRELLPLLTSRALSLSTRGKVFVTYVRSAMLYGSECWAMKVEDLNRLQRNERSMLRWILNFRLKDRISSDELYLKLQIPTLQSTLILRRLRWYGHTVRSQQWIKNIKDFQVVGKLKPGRPIKRWNDVVNESIQQWNLQDADPHDRLEWRECLNAAMEKSNPLMNGRRL